MRMPSQGITETTGLEMYKALLSEKCVKVRGPFGGCALQYIVL
jgi:hypothetical protein